MCIKVAYPTRPYIQLFNALKAAESNSKDHVRWKIPYSIDPSPAEWLSESIRILRSDGKLDAIIENGCCTNTYFCIKEFSKWSMSICPVCKDLLIEVTK